MKHVYFLSRVCKKLYCPLCPTLRAYVYFLSRVCKYLYCPLCPTLRAFVDEIDSYMKCVFLPFTSHFISIYIFLISFSA